MSVYFPSGANYGPAQRFTGATEAVESFLGGAERGQRFAQNLLQEQRFVQAKAREDRKEEQARKDRLQQALEGMYQDVPGGGGVGGGGGRGGGGGEEFSGLDPDLVEGYGLSLGSVVDDITGSGRAQMERMDRLEGIQEAFDQFGSLEQAEIDELMELDPGLGALYQGVWDKASQENRMPSREDLDGLSVAFSQVLDEEDGELGALTYNPLEQFGFGRNEIIHPRQLVALMMEDPRFRGLDEKSKSHLLTRYSTFYGEMLGERDSRASRARQEQISRDTDRNRGLIGAMVAQLGPRAENVTEKMMDQMAELAARGEWSRVESMLSKATSLRQSEIQQQVAAARLEFEKLKYGEASAAGAEAFRSDALKRSIAVGGELDSVREQILEVEEKMASLPETDVREPGSLEAGLQALPLQRKLEELQAQESELLAEQALAQRDMDTANIRGAGGRMPEAARTARGLTPEQRERRLEIDQQRADAATRKAEAAFNNSETRRRKVDADLAKKAGMSQADISRAEREMGAIIDRGVRRAKDIREANQRLRNQTAKMRQELEESAAEGLMTPQQIANTKANIEALERNIRPELTDPFDYLDSRERDLYNDIKERVEGIGPAAQAQAPQPQTQAPQPQASQPQATQAPKTGNVDNPSSPEEALSLGWTQETRNGQRLLRHPTADPPFYLPLDGQGQ